MLWGKLMASKITFLGTGGDSFVVGKQILSSGGIIIQVDDNQFHLDPGPGATARAKEHDINLRANTAVLVSHAHLNHCNDVNAVIDAMTHGSLDKIGVLVCNKTLVEGGNNQHPYLTEFHKQCLEKVIALESGQRVGVNDAEIRATKAVHTDPATIGFKIFTPEFVLGYTSDTSFSEVIVDDYKGVDILIMNVKFPSDIKEKFHLNTKNAIDLVNKIKPRLAIIQHFGIKMLNADILNEARTISRETKCQVIAAKDGLTINPASYSAKLRTKTLNLY